jgi:hypothetical protein
MRSLILTAILMFIPVMATAQVPASADSLADWQGASAVETYTSGDDTLHVLGDSTWVAEQDVITIGCDLGPKGSFWTFRPAEETQRFVGGVTEASYDRLQSMEACIWYVQVLRRKLASQ